MGPVTELIDFTSTEHRDSAVERARQALENQECVVLPTDTVYGIGADAFSARAVAILLAAKGRGRSMPPPVLIGSRRVMDGLATQIPEAARDLAREFWPGALTLILTAQPTLTWDLGETRGTVALRVPDDEATRELLNAVGPLAVSSANRTGHPAATTAAEAQDMLGESVAVYLDGGERSAQQPSTIVDCTVHPFLVVREGAITREQLVAAAPDGFGEPDSEDGPAAEDTTESGGLPTP